MRNNLLYLFVILLAAACSGAAALTLEVVWSRALVVPLGNSSDSTTAVLAGFMLGIAAGAVLGAHLTTRTVRVLTLYASLELLLSLFALFVPRSIAWLAHLTLAGAAAGQAPPLQALRWSLALLMIASPCLVMGATLPLLLCTIARYRQPARIVGLLYGANTLGATIAASFTGFFGVAHFGLLGCSRRAALASTVAASCALVGGLLDRQFRVTDSNVTPAILVTRPADGTGRAAPTLAITVTFASGFTLLLAEVLWARILTFVFGHDTYAFATLLSTVLLGLALGGFVYSMLPRYDPRRVAALSCTGVAVTLLGSFFGASSVIIRSGRDPFGIADRWVDSGALSLEMLREFAYTPLLVFVPCVLSGINYPATIALFAGKHRSAARATGVIGLANGIGAALGAGVAAFGLLSWVGIQGALSVAALGMGAAAWLTFAAGPGSFRRKMVASWPLLACAMMVWWAPHDLPKRMLRSVVGPRHQQLLFYREARTATVSVIQNLIQGERQLLVNAVNEVTTRLVHDQSFKLLGQLGPLLHPAPRRGVMICLGAGLAAGSVLTHPVERLDVVDLLFAVRQGARHFEEENNHVLDDPRLVLHVNDGRQFLLTTHEQFDFAVVDSTHPKSVDSWILYTREFFQLLRSRLGAGGIVVEWLPLHGLSEREFASVVATFGSVFPQMTLWASAGSETYGQLGYAKLVGHNSSMPLRIDVEQLRDRLAQPSIKRDLERYGMDSLPEILDQFVAGPERIREWTKGAPLLTDDLPFLAYTTELSHGRAMTPDLLLGMREFPARYLVHREALPSELNRELELAFDAQGLVLTGDLLGAQSLYPSGKKIHRYLEQKNTTLPYYEGIARIYPDDSERLFESATQLSAQGHEQAAIATFVKARSVAPRSPRLLLNEALLAFSQGQSRLALQRLVRLRSRYPRWSLLNQNLGVTFLAEGEPGAAKRALLLALEQSPQALGARDALVDAHIALGEWLNAESALLALRRDEPHIDRDAWRLALVREKLGKPQEALELFAVAARMNPYSERYAIDWAERLASSDALAAQSVLERAAHIRSDSSKLLVALGNAYARDGKWLAASDVFERALERDAQDVHAALGLGFALARLEKPDAARDAFCIAKKLGASGKEVETELRTLGGPCANPGDSAP